MLTPLSFSSGTPLSENVVPVARTSVVSSTSLTPAISPMPFQVQPRNCSGPPPDQNRAPAYFSANDAMTHGMTCPALSAALTAGVSSLRMLLVAAPQPDVVCHGRSAGAGAV